MSTAVARPTIGEKLEPYIAIIGPMAMIVAVLIFMGVAEPARYFRATNLNLILLDAALYMPMAMAMTFVITQRGIDLSIGSIAALSGILMAFLIKQYGFSVYVAVPIAIMLGAVMGLINGLIITRFNVPDLIGTLAMDLVYRGFALVIAKGLVLARFPDFLTEIGRGQIPGFVPIPVLIGIATMIAGYILLTRTYFGRYTIAIGSNPEAAELTGISVNRHKVYAYVLCGACAALAGVMLTGKLNAIQATSAPIFQLACHRGRCCWRHVALRRSGVDARFVRGRASALNDDQCPGDASDRVLLAVGRLGRRDRQLSRALRLDAKEGSRWGRAAGWPPSRLRTDRKCCGSPQPLSVC